MLPVAAARAPAGPLSGITFRDETAKRLVAADEVGAQDSAQKAFAVGDVDRDGDDDVIVARMLSWTHILPGLSNVFLRNEGIDESQDIDGVLVERTFELAQASQDGGLGFFDPTADRDVILIDVDGDDWLDIVTVATLSDGLPKNISHPRVYRNRGLLDDRWGGFVYEPDRIPPLAVTPGGKPVSPRFSALAAGDVDADGDLDLYLLNDDTGPQPYVDLDDRLLLNDGEGFFEDSARTMISAEFAFSSEGSSIALADLNADGYLDIVKSDARGPWAGVRVALNDPIQLGTFRELEPWVDEPVLGMGVGLLDDDGKPDVVIANDFFNAFLLESGPSAGAAVVDRRLITNGIEPNAGSRGDVLIADLNRDGWDDVIFTDVDAHVRGCDGTLRICWNLGASSGQVVCAQSLHGVHDVAVLDLNNDGWNDLLVGTCGGTTVLMANPPAARFHYPAGVPAFVWPNRATQIPVETVDLEGRQIFGTSVVAYVAVDNGPFEARPLSRLKNGPFVLELEGTSCSTLVRWYLEAELPSNDRYVDPPKAPEESFVAATAIGAHPGYINDFESNTESWTVVNGGVVDGMWEVGKPVGTTWLSQPAAPGRDVSRVLDGGRAFVTGNGPVGGGTSRYDVDGGPTYLVSPAVDLDGNDAVISFAWWFFCSDREQTDLLIAEVSNDDGLSWTPVLSTAGTDGRWEFTSFRVGAHVRPTSTVRVRFGVADEPSNSITEAAIDEFRVLVLDCPQEPPAVIVSSGPPSDAIDARQPSLLDGTGLAGWDALTITLSRNVGALTMSDVAISQLGSSDATPCVVAVEPLGGTSVLVSLDSPIKPGSWTTIQLAGVSGGVRLGYLPGDVTADGTSGPLDILAIVDAVNGVGPSRPVWSKDIDRSGEVNGLDILRLIDLHNGAGEFEAWSGRSLP